MTRQLLLPFMPKQAARSIRARPDPAPALAPLGLIAAAALLLDWPRTVEGALRHLPPSVSLADREWAREMLMGGVALRCVVQALLAWSSAAAFALLLHLLGRFVPSPERPRYGQLLTLSLTAALIPALGDLLAAIGGWQTPAGMALGTPGMAWIAPQGVDIAVFSLLRMTNVLTLWYLVALGAGLRVLYGCPIPCSFLLGASGWALSAAAQIWLLGLVRSLLHLPLN